MLQPESIALATGIIDQQETANDGVVQSDYGPPAIADDAISRTDPIEDFPHDKSTNPHSQPANVNSLPSPVKHKRNTERAAGNRAALTGNLAIFQEEIEQPISAGQEPCTTELVQEGLMSGNSKKQRSASCDEHDVLCLNNDRSNEETTRAESCQGPNKELNKYSEQFRNSEVHCCSYAAVKQDSAVPGNGIQGHYGIISLFDGVSSVVRILKQKLQQPPVAIILAEQMKGSAVWSVLNLDIDPMNSGGTRSMVLPAVTYVMSTPFSRMIVTCYGKLCPCTRISSGSLWEAHPAKILLMLVRLRDCSDWLVHKAGSSSSCYAPFPPCKS